MEGGPGKMPAHAGRTFRRPVFSDPHRFHEPGELSQAEISPNVEIWKTAWASHTMVFQNQPPVNLPLSKE